MFYVLFVGYWLILSGTTIFAFRCGGMSERVGSGMIAVSSLLTPLARNFDDTRWQRPQLGLFLLELVLLIGLTALAFRSRRYWPMTVASLQVLAVLTHPAVAIDGRILPISYALLQGFWAYPMLFAIVVGTINHRRMSRLTPSSPTSSASSAPMTVH